MILHLACDVDDDDEGGVRVRHSIESSIFLNCLPQKVYKILLLLGDDEF